MPWLKPVAFSLTLSGVVSLTLLWLLIHQKRFTIFTSLFAYAVAIFFIEVMATLVALASSAAETRLLAHTIRLITAIYFPVVLYAISRSIQLRPSPPHSPRTPWLLFAVATVLASGTWFSLYFAAPSTTDWLFPHYRNAYWLVIAFWGVAYYLIFHDLLLKYRQCRRQEEIDALRLALLRLFPLVSLMAIVVYALPFWGIPHPLLLGVYLPGSLLLFYAAVRFRILRMTHQLEFMLPQLILTTVLLLALYPWFPEDQNFGVYHLLTTGLALLAIVGSELTSLFHQRLNREERAAQQAFEQKLEKFTAEVTTYLEPEKFWEYVGHYCQALFQFNRCAILAFQYDVQPYQLVYVKGFDTGEFQSMITGNPSAILDVLESERQTLHIQQYAEDSTVYQAMNRLGIDAVVPIFDDGTLAGIIFLGNDRRTFASEQMLARLPFFASHVAVAYRNLKIIRQTLQAQKMAEIGMLASQLAHDFQSFIALVKLENTENERLVSHAQYMEKLVQDLLHFVRPQQLNLTPININDLIDMTLDVLDIPPDVIIEKHYAEDLPEVKVDIGEMRRVFINLLENSLRAMQQAPRKRIKITTRRLRPISRFQLSPWLYIEILDEGEGIPEELLDKIFEPFFTTHKHRGGNGLGLAIVKQIVTRHQGYIDVTSRPGKGTIFSIRIPFLIQ